MSDNNTSSLFIQTRQRRSSLARMSMEMRTIPAYLLYISDDGARQRFDLVKPIYTLGRRESNDIVLQCSQISKDHASIEATETGYLIRDRNSVNGVLINNVAVQSEQHLKDGDWVQLGSVLLQFHDRVDLSADDNTADKESDKPQVSQVPPVLQPQQPIPNTGSIKRINYTSAGNRGTISVSRMGSRGSNGTGAGSYETFRQNPLTSSSTSSSSNSSYNNTPSSTRHHTLGRRSYIRRSMVAPASPQLSNVSKELELVTILPQDKKYEDTITVRAELKDDTTAEQVFQPASKVTSEEMLRNDYEKLRLVFELSRLGLTDIDELLEKTLELMFSVLPVDRGVVMLVDRKTGMLTTNKVKMREGSGREDEEILLSYTILQKVFSTKSCLITSDAFEDPLLGQAASIAIGMIRSVICVPMIAHGQVLGILHLDSRSRLNAFAEKDLGLVKAIANQTAIILENCKLIQDVEREVCIRENLGRFLAPHVVDRVITRGEEPIRKGGRQTFGTILFADIRGFTQMSEKKSAQEVVELLNEFFERLVNIVFKYDGILDKYIGDCLMATFGTLPEQEKDAELNAIRAALEFKQAVAEMNSERAAEGKEPIVIGVGLNSGQMVSGFIGSSQRLEYTCIGDTVNTASRVCNMASENQVLITEYTKERLDGRVELQFISNKQFKGKSNEIGVFEVVSLNE